jgi:hypothetical protein
MRKHLLLICVAAGLAACGQSSDQAAANQAAANEAATKTPRPAYCFFKDSETKGWKAKLDKSGNVTVSGKVYRLDSRYKAVLGPAVVDGDKASIAPTLTQNDTGFGAPGSWWDVEQMIPDSQTVTTVTVTCGDKTLATLDVPRKG